MSKCCSESNSEKERLERAEERFLAHGPIGSTPRKTQPRQAAINRNITYESDEDEQIVAERQRIKERDNKRIKKDGPGFLSESEAEDQDSDCEFQPDDGEDSDYDPVPPDDGDLDVDMWSNSDESELEGISHMERARREAIQLGAKLDDDGAGEHNFMAAKCKHDPDEEDKGKRARTKLDREPTPMEID
ncbi:hypothetical protein FALBO_9347 [Fusarium albosuccineum]|uniref:Uncharacterized protein n=2 Tax=Fusarium decemcellulare species complex TaxID=1329916 RepID=A0A8H4P614_9HYPO|nr:hypothetical protein FALBO_9347 [Fusarium albosuccineum]KAF5011228.1 hypothetical protein FDECE_2627 [Fusarium decemcellulare]KAJ3542754.1 hypothetical protein NM208_g3924 [Fusarium decemcellulare]